MGSAESVYEADRRQLGRIDGLTAEEYTKLSNKDLTAVRKILSDCMEKGIGILTQNDSAYPRALTTIGDVPAVLYTKGTVPSFECAPGIGLVGTRNASGHGLRMARKLGREIAACGGIVVSGGAKGIDGEGLWGAIDVDKPCVAVLAGGVDITYPKTNQPLFDAILAKGCLISEYPPGTPHMRWNFLQRNRIISGISSAVVVVEAPERSGALNTANWAFEQSRDVYCVPGNAENADCAGSNALLKDGARAVSAGWDVMEEFAAIYPDAVCRTKVCLPEVFPTEPEPEKPKKKTPVNTEKPKSDKKAIDNEEKSTYSVLNDPYSQLNEQERLVADLLTKEPRHLDELVEASGLPAAKLLVCITGLVMKGIAKNHPGRRVSRK